MVLKPGNRSWRGYVVSVLRDTQNLTGQSLEQPVLTDRDLSREVGPASLQRSLPDSTIPLL